ncbi:hypothetical protein X943_000125 [Babesia divergens]|uniref:FHA domain-containing protein n=1 Tax=Babesia divergens TaxID=32595 RepID=A0AAD9GC97_BABDI|nr:hypothetical protein X943_000125 [Babesia divergens]
MMDRNCSDDFSKNPAHGLCISDLDCAVHVNFQKLRSFRIDEHMSARLCKRPAIIRTPRRKHHEHEMQHSVATDKNCLNLQQLGDLSNASLSKADGNIYGLAALNLISSSFTASARSDTSNLLSGRSVTSDGSSCISYDVVLSDVIVSMDISRAGTLQHSISESGRMNGEPDKDEPTGNMYADSGKTIIGSDLICPTAESMNNVVTEELVRRVHKDTSLCSSVNMDRPTSFSTNVDSDNGGYVESDCEGYCTGRLLSKSVSAETNISIDTSNQIELPDTNVLRNNSSSRDAIHPDSDCHFTYSTNAQFGMLRLFFQGDSNHDRSNDHCSIPQRIVISKSPFVIGNECSCDLFLDREKYKHVFGRHCKIVLTECKDVESGEQPVGITAYKVDVVKINPEATIFVNNIPVRMRTRLKDGDIISLCPKKFAVSFMVVFRTRESCYVLLEQMNSLMLTPSSGIEFTRRTETMRRHRNDVNCTVEDSCSDNCKVDLEHNVNVGVFEIYYGTPSINAVCTPCSFESPRNKDIGYSISKDIDPLAMTPLLERIGGCSIQDGKSQGDIVAERPGSPLSGMLLNGNFNDVIQSPLNLVVPYPIDDESTPCNLLLSTYTTGLEDVGIVGVDTSHNSLNSRRNDETYLRQKASKIAKLRALNRHSFPIVVDSSRSLSSDCDSDRVTAPRIRYLGVIRAAYQSTLNDLIPSINELLIGGIENSSADPPMYDLVLKRRDEPLSEEQRRYNWVFQLDFFDRDDPLFRRAIYSSQKGTQVDKERLHRLVEEICDQLSRSRVLYIQSR